MTFSEMLTLIEAWGIPGVFTALALWLGYKLINAGFADHERIGKSYDELRKENVELLVHNRELEKKLTVCVEKLARTEGDKALTEQAQSYAVAEYLDDTHNYTAEIRDLEERLREASETISILQNTNKQLKALQSATELPNEMNESQKGTD